MGNFKVTEDILKQIQSEKGGVSKTYSKGDITKAWSDNYKYGLALTDEQIDLVLQQLNERGHSENNLFNALDYLYNGPSLLYSHHPVTLGEKFKERIGNTLKFVGNTLDIPRKVLASVINWRGENNAYHPGRILNVMGNNEPTPTLGYNFARNNPKTSAAVDVLAPIGLGTMFGGINYIVKNGLSYANRQLVPSISKNSALLTIRSGNVPSNIGYEVVDELVPTVQKTSFNGVRGGNNSGIVITRTGTQGTNGMRHRPMVQNHSTTGNYVNGNLYTTPGYKILQSVYSWPMTPFMPVPFMPGLVLEVNNMQDNTPVQSQEHTIIETIPVDITDSEIINWAIKNKGFLEGDIIEMPDGRKIKYSKGSISHDKSSLGKTYNFGVEKEYDRHNKEPKELPNIPSKTKLIQGKTKGSVKIKSGKNPQYEKRDSTNYFPYIIPIRN